MFDSMRNMINSFSGTFFDREQPVIDEEKEKTSDCLDQTDKMYDGLSGKLNAAKEWSTVFLESLHASGESTSKKVTEKLQFVTRMDKIVPEVLQKVPFWREFNENQEAFAVERSQHPPIHAMGNDILSSSEDAAADELVPPWHPDVSGLRNPTAIETLKSRILALSGQVNTFLIAPPKEARLTDISVGDSEDSVDATPSPLRSPAALQLAYSLLRADEKLARMRYQLVPSRVSEAAFWRNYLYRVSVLQQSAQLSAMTGESPESDDSNGYICVDSEPDPGPADQTRLPTDSETPAKTESSQLKTKWSRRRNISDKRQSAASRLAPSDSQPCVDATKKESHQPLTADEELEAELAREVDELLTQKGQGDPERKVNADDEDELDAELELQILAELDKVQTK